MSTPQTAVTSDPTKRAYLDDDEIRMILLWDRHMPNGGRLEEVNYGTAIQKKPIQVFDAKPESDRSKTWQFQAQDGSFLCSMNVSEDQNTVKFLNNRKGNFPQITVHARFP